MPVAKITDKHMQMLKEIAHASGADPDDPKAVAGAFHAAVSSHHARVTGAKAPPAGGAPAVAKKAAPEGTVVPTKHGEGKWPDDPNAEAAAFKRLGPEVDEHGEPPESSSASSSDDDDTDGVSTDDAGTPNPLRRWARGGNKKKKQEK